jgi:hypothetical protein
MSGQVKSGQARLVILLGACRFVRGWVGEHRLGGGEGIGGWTGWDGKERMLAVASDPGTDQARLGRVRLIILLGACRSAGEWEWRGWNGLRWDGTG